MPQRRQRIQTREPRLRGDDAAREEIPGIDGAELGTGLHKNLSGLEIDRQKLQAINIDLEERIVHLQAVVRDLTDQYDLSPDGHVTLTPDGVIQTINITCAKMLGTDRLSLLGTSFIRYVIENDYDKFLDHMRRCAETDSQIATELALCSKDKPLFVELLTIPVSDGAKGKVYRTAVVNVTRRVLAERSLHENEQRYRSLVNLSPDAIWVHRNGRFITANPAAATLFNVKSEKDLINRNMLDFFTPAAARSHEAELRKLRDRKIELPHREERQLEFHHATINVEMTICEFEPKAAGGAIMVIARDISLRKRAEELLHQAEERFSKAFHASPVAISISTIDGHFIDVNSNFLRMFGFMREEVIGRTVLETSIHLDPRNREKVMDKLRAEKSVRNYDITLKTKSGWHIDVLESLELVELSGQVCILTIWEDVTERRRLEREILEISEREQSRVGQDLHDGVCQDLTGIAFLAEGLAKNLAAKKLSPTKAAAEVRDLAKYVREVIGDTHNLATGLYPVRIEDNGLMSGLQELATDTATRFGIRCVFKCEQPVVVRNNEIATHLYRIAQEAVANAVKHGTPGIIGISLSRAENEITLAIDDNGKGLPKRVPMRPGMGVKTMTYRARMINGSLEIRRGTKQGTIVTCTLPVN